MSCSLEGEISEMASLLEYFSALFFFYNVVAFNCLFIIQGFFYRKPPQAPANAN